MTKTVKLKENKLYTTPMLALTNSTLNVCAAVVQYCKWRRRHLEKPRLKFIVDSELV